MKLFIWNCLCLKVHTYNLHKSEKINFEKHKQIFFGMEIASLCFQIQLNIDGWIFESFVTCRVNSRRRWPIITPDFTTTFLWRSQEWPCIHGYNHTHLMSHTKSSALHKKDKFFLTKENIIELQRKLSNNFFPSYKDFVIFKKNPENVCFWNIKKHL